MPRLKHPALTKQQRADMSVLSYGRGEHELCYLRQRSNLEHSVVFNNRKCDGSCTKCFFSSQNSTEFEVRLYFDEKYGEQY